MQTSDLILEEHLPHGEALFERLDARLLVHYRRELLDHPQYGRALKVYVLLTEAPELLEDLGAGAERVLWSRYYWLLRFAKLHRAAEGDDAGIEQQTFQLLEEAMASGDDAGLAEMIAAKVAADVDASRGR